MYFFYIHDIIISSFQKGDNMKYLVILISMILIGCSSDPSGKNGKAPIPNVRCIDGVEYMFFKHQIGIYTGYGYMSVVYNKDSTIKTCE